MSFTFASSAAIIMKAGANASSTATSSGAILDFLSGQAEAYINASARVDLIANYSTLNTNTRKILQKIAASEAAKGLIQYDMSGFTSRQEAQTMLDVLDDEVNKGINLIKDKNVTDFM